MPRSQDAHTVGAYQAKTNFSQLLDKVAAGEEITIAKHGAPVAKLVPVKVRTSPSERLTAIQRIQKLGEGLSLSPLKIKDLVAKGRK